MCRIRGRCGADACARCEARHRRAPTVRARGHIAGRRPEDAAYRGRKAYEAQSESMNSITKSTLSMLAAYILVTLLVAWWMSGEFRTAARGVMDETARLIGHEVSAALHDVSVENLVRGDAQARERLSASLGTTARESSVLNALSIVDRAGRVVASDGVAAARTQLARPEEVFSEDRQPRLYSTFSGLFDSGSHVLLTPILEGDALVGYLRMNLNSRVISHLFDAAYWRLLLLSLAGLVAIVSVGLLSHVRMTRFQYRVTSLFDSALAGKKFEEHDAGDELGHIEKVAHRLGRELHEARGRAEHREHELAILATALKVGMLLLGPDGEIKFSNAAATDMLTDGSPRQFPKWDAKIRERLRGTLEAMRQQGVSAREIDVEEDFQGKRRRYRIEVYAIVPDDGRRYLAIVKDRDLIDALEIDLRTATRFRGLSVLYVGAAHDLRGPLNNMVVNLELLKQTLKTPGTAPPEAVRQRNYIETIQQEIYRLNRYVQALLDLTAPSHDPRGELDLVQALNEISGLIRAQAKLQHVQLDWQLPDRPVVVRCHEVQFRQVLLNVIINALEAMPDGGTLSLRLSQDDEQVVVEVCDTGPGIPEALHNRIFDMHFTTKGTGTGIGLYVARSVMEEHGGHIGLRSRSGAGTCFELRLPVSETGSKPLPIAPQESVGQSSGRKRLH